MDQISPRHDKKLGPAPFNVIIGGVTSDTAVSLKYILQ